MRGAILLAACAGLLPATVPARGACALPGGPLGTARGDSAVVRLVPSGAGPRTARLSTLFRNAAVSRCNRGPGGQREAIRAEGGLSWVDVPCDVGVAGDVGARQWAATATLLRAAPSAQTPRPRYAAHSLGADALVSALASPDGALVQETVGVIAARIPDSIPARDVRRVELWFSVVATNLLAHERVGLTELSSRARPTQSLSEPALRQLYADARGLDGKIYCLDYLPVGDYVLDLGASAASDFARRAQAPGWFGVGLAADRWDVSGSPDRMVYWRVAGGAGTAGEQRPFFRIYYNAPPDAFALLDPPDGAVVAAAAPTLSWARSSDPHDDAPLAYTVRLSTDPYLRAAFTVDAGERRSITVPLPLVSGTYFWEVSARDPQGAVRTSDRWRFRLERPPADARARTPSDRTPTFVSVSSPLAAPTQLTFHLPRAGDARLWIADARGRRRAQLLAGELLAGEHHVTWNGDGAAGGALASGVYFAVLQTTQGEVRTRLTLVH